MGACLAHRLTAASGRILEVTRRPRMLERAHHLAPKAGLLLVHPRLLEERQATVAGLTRPVQTPRARLQGRLPPPLDMQRIREPRVRVVARERVGTARYEALSLSEEARFESDLDSKKVLGCTNQIRIGSCRNIPVPAWSFPADCSDSLPMVHWNGGTCSLYRRFGVLSNVTVPMQSSPSQGCRLAWDRRERNTSTCIIDKHCILLFWRHRTVIPVQSIVLSIPTTVTGYTNRARSEPTWGRFRCLGGPLCFEVGACE